MQPSLIRSNSRLRAKLGLSLLQSIDVDYRGFEPADTNTLLPFSVWGLPDTRLALVSHIRQVTSEADIPLRLPQVTAQAGLFHALSGVVGMQSSSYHSTDVLEGTVDVKESFSGHPDSVTKTVRLLKMPLRHAVYIAPEHASKVRPVGQTHQIAVDLRRLVLDPPSSATLVHLQQIAEKLASNLRPPGSKDDVDVTIRVASDKVAKVCEEAIASSGAHLGTYPCRVVKE